MKLMQGCLEFLSVHYICTLHALYVLHAAQVLE